MLGGARFSYLKRPEQQTAAWYSEIELSAKFEIFFYRLDSADAPNVDRTRAFVGQAAAALRF